MPAYPGDHTNADFAFVPLFLLVVFTRKYIARLAPELVFGHLCTRSSENAPLLTSQIDGGAELTFTGWNTALLPGVLASGVGLVLSSVLLCDGLTSIRWAFRYLLPFCILNSSIIVLTVVILARIFSYVSSAATLDLLGTFVIETGTIIALTPLIALATGLLFYGDDTWLGFANTFVLGGVVVPLCGTLLIWWGAWIAGRSQ